jgi:hypothetical protein
MRQALLGAIRQIMPADLKLTVDGDQVKFRPLTALGRKWIGERGAAPDRSYSVCWNRPKRIAGSDYENALGDIARWGLVVDDTELPEELSPASFVVDTELDDEL